MSNTAQPEPLHARVGAIGDTGHIGYLFQGLDALPGLVLSAAAPGGPGETLEELQWHAGERGLTFTRYDDYRAMLDREQLDLVVVTPLLARQADITVECLRRGLPVFCEKPMALTFEALSTVRAAQQASGCPIGMMLDFRYAPAFHTARRLVAAGAIGTPTVGYSQKSYKRGDRPDYYKHRATFGGIIPWVGIHAIDWFRWVSGTEYARVSAQHVKLHRPDFPDMEDAATCRFTLANGGTAVMSFDFLRPAGAATHGDDRLRLLGERGALEVEGRERLTLITERGVQPVELEHPPFGLFADFALSVLAPGHAAVLSTADVFRATEVALRARDAADRGVEVRL